MYDGSGAETLSHNFLYRTVSFHAQKSL